MKIIDKTQLRFEAKDNGVHFVLWVDNEDSNGQWFIRVINQSVRIIDGWWSDSQGKSVYEAIEFAIHQFKKIK